MSPSETAFLPLFKVGSIGLTIHTSPQLRVSSVFQPCVKMLVTFYSMRSRASRPKCRSISLGTINDQFAVFTDLFHTIFHFWFLSFLFLCFIPPPLLESVGGTSPPWTPFHSRRFPVLSYPFHLKVSPKWTPPLLPPFNLSPSPIHTPADPRD